MRINSPKAQFVNFVNFVKHMLTKHSYSQPHNYAKLRHNSIGKIAQARHTFA